MKIHAGLFTLVVVLGACGQPEAVNPNPIPAQDPLPMSEVRDIAREAFVWGFPVVEGYKSLYQQAIDKTHPGFHAGLNQIGSVANVATPQDTTIITPNSDTPYSFLWMDLRAEPLVIRLPKVDAGRYVSVQLVDLYTFNFAYIHGTDVTEDWGEFMVAGPGWQGDVPAGVTQVFRSETELAYGLFRTQMFSPDDLANVQRLQSQYDVRPLSTFLGTAPPPAAPPIDFPPYRAEAAGGLGFFQHLNFLLQFMPTAPSEQALMSRLAKIGVVPGEAFDADAVSQEHRDALLGGIQEAETQLDEFVKTKVNPGKVTSAQLFGSREFLGENYLHRFAGAKLGIYGNSASEADYLSYFVDRDGAALHGGMHDYVLRFEPGQLPPTRAFWSVTLYDGKTKLLSENAINRYLINSTMLPGLARDDSGGVSIYIQHQPPVESQQANWLPAPDGPFYMVLRNYQPDAAVIERRWKKPPLVPTR